MYTFLQTERLVLRPITLSDSGFILSLVNSDGWLQFIGDRKIRNVTDAEKYIQKIIDSGNSFYTVFEIEATKTPIGIVTFLYRGNYQFPDIGFATLPDFGKKGYTYEASKRYLDEIVARKVSSKVLGITVSGNKNSIQLLEKLGLEFSPEYAETNGLAVYSMNIPS